ncbi:MAG: MarC family protein [Candidatus Paracaedibacteraceae bacterium]|nr:MarC family protein [Candidatus Paracaedibacteraceae bacterium]
MSDFIFQAFVTLLVIVNPFSVVPVFVSLTQNDSIEVKRKVAKKACLISVVLLLLFAFLGDWLLTLMHISPEAFRITGGLLLLLAAIQMVLSDRKSSPVSSSEKIGSNTCEDVAVYPLAIPLLAGPGALTTVALLMRRAHDMPFYAEASIIGVVLLISAISLMCLLIGDRLMRVLGDTGTNVLTRVFGIILSAVAINNIIDGLVSVIKQAHA